MSGIELAPGCWSDGRVVGSIGTLLIDPVKRADTSATDHRVCHAVLTDADGQSALRSLRPARPGRLFVHTSLVAKLRRVPFEVRGVHTVALIDLGGVVAEITHLGAARTAADLVVSARAVDDRGRVRRDHPPVVYTGVLLDPGTRAVSKPSRDGSEQGWSAVLDLLGGLLGAAGIAVSRDGTTHGHSDVEDQRATRLEAGGLIRMPDPDKRLPLV